MKLLRCSFARIVAFKSTTTLMALRAYVFEFLWKFLFIHSLQEVRFGEDPHFRAGRMGFSVELGCTVIQEKGRGRRNMFVYGKGF